MRKNDQYCVGGCNNNKRYLHNITKRAHVAIMKWHGFKSDPSKHEQWIKLTGKGRENFSLANGHTFVQIILLMPNQQLQTRTLLVFLQFQTKKLLF